MSSTDSPTSSPLPPAPAATTPRPFTVFLSYASDDRVIAERICLALRAAGIDVWFDAAELRGGDAWDDLIRQRIKHCSFFVALISAATQAREEGYFRREWKLAIERSHDMADDRPFILPVTITPIRHDEARVPQKLLELQWTHLPGGDHPELLVQRLEQLQRRVSSGHTPLPFPLPRSRPRQGRPWLRWSLLALVGAGIWAALEFRPQRPPASAEPARSAPVLDPRAVAVLPFRNLSGDPKDDYLADGLGEELLATLARDPALRIMAGTSSFAFKGKGLTAQQIAAQLGVATLLEGTLRREGDMLKIAVRIISGSTGFGKWGGDYAPHAAELAETQAAMARDVASRLLPAGAVPVKRPMTRNLDAYDAFLRARSLQSRAPDRANLEQAASYYRRAIEADSEFAIAWAHYAAVLLRLHTYGHDDTEATLQTARAAIQRALNIEPQLPEAHYAFANYYTMNWTNQALAEKELLLARQGLPNDPDILISLASNCANRGRRREAVNYARQATALDPQNGDAANAAAWLLELASDYSDAIAERDRAFRLGGWANSLFEKAYATRNWKGDLALALSTLDAALPTLDPATASGRENRNTYWRLRAGYLRSQHNYTAALQAIEQIDAEVLPTQFYYHLKPFLRATILEELGRPDAARADYEAALREAERYRAANPTIVRAHTSIALILAGLGRESDARVAIDHFLGLVPPNDNPLVVSRTAHRILVQVHARFGRTDAALEIVRAQIAAGFWRRNDLLLDADWETLRKDPRFLELARTAPL